MANECIFPFWERMISYCIDLSEIYKNFLEYTEFINLPVAIDHDL